MATRARYKAKRNRKARSKGRSPRRRRGMGSVSAGSVASTFGQELILKAVGIGVATGAAYFLVIKPVLQKVGIIDTPEDKARKEAAQVSSTSQASPWSPTYYKSIPNAKILTMAAAKNIAKQIWDALGTWVTNDNEQGVYGALRQITTKTQLSFVAEVFYKEYGKDLYSTLVDHFSDSELDVVNGIANGLKGIGRKGISLA